MGEQVKDHCQLEAVVLGIVQKMTCFPYIEKPTKPSKQKCICVSKKNESDLRSLLHIMIFMYSPASQPSLTFFLPRRRGLGVIDTWVSTTLAGTCEQSKHDFKLFLSSQSKKNIEKRYGQTVCWCFLFFTCQCTQLLIWFDPGGSAQMA